MITRLAVTKNFGVFHDFVWRSDLAPFERHTLIYGWNYSGKTTLSRIFQCFETRQNHHDYRDAVSSLSLSEGGTATSSSYPSDLHVRVFNSDFIRENLKWEEGLKPILILGVEHIELIDQLEKLNEDIQAANATKVEFRRSRESKASLLEKRMTDVARNIGEVIGSRTYRRPNLQSTLSALGNSFLSHVLAADDYDLIKQRYLSNDKKDSVDALAFGPPDLVSLNNDARSKLATTVRSRVIERLRSDEAVNNWVRDGLALHQDQTTCQFCERELPEGLVENLTAHFSEEYENLVLELDALSTRVNNSKKKPALPPRESFYLDLQTDFKAATSSFLKDFGEVERQLDVLVQSINDKRKNVFQTVECPDCSADTTSLRTAIEKINGLIQSHNARTAKFDDERKDLAERIERHLVASFIKDDEYYTVQSEIERFDSAIKTADSALLDLDHRKRSIEAKISEAVKGAERINEYLRAFFAKDDLEVVVNNGSYQLRRGAAIARNLSEGERTAIAFAYFIASLENKDTKLEESIIFVDDPISSLDANHVYNTYAFIRQRLAGAKQLFIATHNSEFFNLIKSWFNEDQRKPKKQKWSGYLVERVDMRTSTIRGLPKELLQFKSEYHYLFSILYRFSNQPQTEFQYLFQLPNLVRRFLEAFAGFTIPTNQNLDTKLHSLIPDTVERYKVYKFINEYSHNGTLDRTLNLPVLQECREIVTIALNAAKNRDAIHYDHMVDEMTERNER